MAEIKMSYIFIEKEKHESKILKEVLLEIIDEIVQVRDDEILKVNDIDIKYRIIQKKKSKRCFLEMTSSARVNRCIPALQKVDVAFFKSSQQKYYYAIRDYDGISESFCKRLYPKYAEFERKLRSLILFILTKAYGSRWQSETVSQELLNVIQENAHGKVSLNETLENMDLNTLETYLFEKRPVDYAGIINKKLSVECLEKLEKEEICSIIEEMRETSLWERHFEKYGKQKDWEKKISEVHKIRNKVAHQKTITIEEFTDTNRKLNAINRNLSNAIEGIREENFTENSIVDILGSFAILAGSKVKNIAQSQAFKDVVIGFSAKIQEMLKPMKEIYKSGVVKTLSDWSNTYEKLNLGIAQSQMVKNMGAIAESFSAASSSINSSISAKAIADSFPLSEAFGNTNMAEVIQNSCIIPQQKRIKEIEPFQDYDEQPDNEENED